MSSPTTDELVGALHEIRAAREARRTAEGRLARASDTGRALVERLGVDHAYGTDTALSIAIAERVLEDRQRPAKPDNTLAFSWGPPLPPLGPQTLEPPFKPGEIVEDKRLGRGIVRDFTGSTLAQVEWLDGSSEPAWVPTGILRAVPHHPAGDLIATFKPGDIVELLPNDIDEHHGCRGVVTGDVEVNRVRVRWTCDHASVGFPLCEHLRLLVAAKPGSPE